MKINQVDTVVYIVGIKVNEYEAVKYFSTYSALHEIFADKVDLVMYPLGAAKFAKLQNAQRFASNFKDSVIHKLTISGYVEEVVETELALAT